MSSGVLGGGGGTRALWFQEWCGMRSLWACVLRLSDFNFEVTVVRTIFGYRNSEENRVAAPSADL